MKINFSKCSAPHLQQLKPGLSTRGCAMLVLTILFDLLVCFSCLCSIQTACAYCKLDRCSHRSQVRPPLVPVLCCLASQKEQQIAHHCLVDISHAFSLLVPSCASEEEMVDLFFFLAAVVRICLCCAYPMQIRVTRAIPVRSCTRMSDSRLFRESYSMRVCSPGSAVSSCFE